MVSNRKIKFLVQIRITDYFAESVNELFEKCQNANDRVDYCVHKILLIKYSFLLHICAEFY